MLDLSQLRNNTVIQQDVKNDRIIGGSSGTELPHLCLRYEIQSVQTKASSWIAI